jgi:RimJ/RimL family protein N-acetyltransferase
MQTKFLFFRTTSNRGKGPDHPLPAGYRLAFWEPRLAHWSGTPGRKVDLVWWLFHQLHVFRNGEFSVCRIWTDSQLVHRSTVFPPFFRFPFMAPDDLQIGDTWTMPSERGRGLAASAIHHILLARARPGRAFWYVVSEDNAASIKVIEKCGFELHGTGVRTRRLGLSVLAEFRLTHPRSVAGARGGPDSTDRCRPSL